MSGRSWARPGVGDPCADRAELGRGQEAGSPVGPHPGQISRQTLNDEPAGPGCPARTAAPAHSGATNRRMFLRLSLCPRPSGGRCAAARGGCRGTVRGGCRGTVRGGAAVGRGGCATLPRVVGGGRAVGRHGDWPTPPRRAGGKAASPRRLARRSYGVAREKAGRLDAPTPDDRAARLSPATSRPRPSLPPLLLEIQTGVTCHQPPPRLMPTGHRA